MNLFYYLAVIAFTYIVSAALRPKPATPLPAALEDLDFPQSTEGTPQCVVFGDVWLEDWMVLGVGNFRTEPIQK